MFGQKGFRIPVLHIGLLYSDTPLIAIDHTDHDVYGLGLGYCNVVTWQRCVPQSTFHLSYTDGDHQWYHFLASFDDSNHVRKMGGRLFHSSPLPCLVGVEMHSILGLWTCRLYGWRTVVRSLCFNPIPILMIARFYSQAVFLCSDL